ncbi:MAG TPA: serine/threonine-protein kinase [Gemmatimonadaceae bacterium]|nr:serine/threonine-protein kinase [Gemmatimonadaceae bacterium]
MNRCPFCGTTYAADARFCPRDGTRLVTLAPMTSGSPSEARPARGRAEARASSEDPSARATAPVERGGAPRIRLRPDNLASELLDGRYRMLRKVGEGGMAFVYLAEDVATHERYAIKVLSPALSEDANAMARLRREAGLGMRLDHPNVCHIMRLGETEDGLIYAVMPFVEGEILADRTVRLGRIPLEDAVGFVRDMANGLHAAHQLKIVHRDLKPENVMICRRASGGEMAIVLDFGLAKERRAEGELQKLTATGIILGTPEFMSPEQIRGRTLDGRSDVYSLALLVFEMLTGKLPFQGRTQQEMMIARLRNAPTPLRRMRPELGFSEALERVLNRGMERSADDRYQSTLEFADAFEVAARAPEAGSGAVGESRLLGRLFGRSG